MVLVRMQVGKGNKNSHEHLGCRNDDDGDDEGNTIVKGIIKYIRELVLKCNAASFNFRVVSATSLKMKKRHKFVYKLRL